MLFILEDFVFTHKNVNDEDIELEHHFGVETFKMYPDINALYFSQCFAEGNLYVIVLFTTIVKGRPKNIRIMLHINENVWCEYDKKKKSI